MTHVHTHLYSCLGSVIVSQSAETPSVTPSPLLHKHTHTLPDLLPADSWSRPANWRGVHSDFENSGHEMSTTSSFGLEKERSSFEDFTLLFTSWQNGDVQTHISPLLTPNLFFFSSKVLGVSHRVRSQLTWPKLEICAWQDSLLSHDLCSHHGHALKLTFFPLLPVFSSSTLILHPSYSCTLMLKCF